MKEKVAKRHKEVGLKISEITKSTPIRNMRKREIGADRQKKEKVGGKSGVREKKRNGW